MSVVTLPIQHKTQPQRPAGTLETVASPSQHTTRNAQHAVLVSRESELARLQSIFERALQGERQIVFVTGEAGIGKTALIDAFLARIPNHVNAVVASGQCVEQYGPGEAYMPLLEATQRLCRGPDGERGLEILQHYAPSWLAQLPGLLEPHAWERQQQRVQGASRERMLREMAEAAELFTTQRGLILILEDLHWSDVSTLDWVTYMARRREPAKLLILGTYRPTENLITHHPLRGVVQELLIRRQSQELMVAPLGENAVDEYLRCRFGELALPAGVTATLTRRSGGNPLFIVNMVNDLVRQDAVTKAEGSWIARPEKIIGIVESVPDTVRQLIERQVERLSEVEQRLLEVASVAGVEFTSMDVTAGVSATVEEIEASCERFARAGQWLRTAGLTEWPDGTIGGRYTFLHAMYHEVIYARVAEARRLQLHRRIAERKEATSGERVGEIAAELAVHFEKGRDLTRAVHYLGKAGKTAIRRGAHQEAIAHFTRGLELLETFPDTPERKQRELVLQVALGVPLLRTKGYAASEVAQAYGRARELCQQIGEQPEFFTALAGLCSFYLVRAELQTARELAEQCLRLAQCAQDSALLVEAHFILGVTLFYSGELTAAQTILERGRAFYDPGDHSSLTLAYGQDPAVGCRSHASLTSWFLGYPDRALEEIHDALSQARELSHSFSVGAALHAAACLRQYRQEEHAVQTHTEEEIALSKTEGFALWLAAGIIQRGWRLSEQGDQEQGLAQLQEGLTALNATGAKLAQSYHLSLLAQTYGKNERPHEGLALLDQALAAIDKTGERYYTAEVYRLKGELTLKINDQRPLTATEKDAETCFLHALEIARSQQAKSLELRAAVSLGRLWRQQNKVTEARTLLEETYCWFTEGFETKDLQEAATLLSELGGEIARKSQGVSYGLKRRAGGSTWAHGHQEPQVEKTLQAGDSRLLAPAPTSASLINLQPLAALFSQFSAVSPHDSSLFRCEGDYWTLRFAGTTCRLKEARGLHYIAQLLQQPHQEIHVFSLITGKADSRKELHNVHSLQDANPSLTYVERLGDAGEILDPQARAAYKQRLNELREELAEAQEFHDLGRSKQLAAEIEFLTHELTNAVGVGEQARRAGSPAERARVNITRAIKLALRKITEHHPALGQHLATTIKTGSYCSYTPDLRLPISWQV